MGAANAQARSQQVGQGECNSSAAGRSCGFASVDCADSNRSFRAAAGQSATPSASSICTLGNLTGCAATVARTILVAARTIAATEGIGAASASEGDSQASKAEAT